MKSALSIFIPLCVLLTCCNTPPPEDKPGPFDKSANAKEQIQQSLATARGSGKHLLLVFGANWCSDSIRMINLLRTDPQITRTLQESYLMTMVDVGPKKDWRNLDLVNRYHATIEQGIPVLVVLDETGNVLNDSREERLLDSDHQHPERVLGFLRKHAPR